MFSNTNTGFRGVEKVYNEIQHYFDIKTVSYSCVRQWVLRIGYGLLVQEVEKRNDWIYIIDFSIQLGTERCLLILGVTEECLKKNGYELKHHQVTVLDIYIREHFNGDAVCQRLKSVENKTGKPYQIISDNGSDVRKGINLFCDGNGPIIETYDVSHMIGVCIKHNLEKDKQWSELQSDLNNFPQKINQTELSFLSPPKSSTKARWMNIKKQIEWMQQIYKYEETADFSLINKGFMIKNHEAVFEMVKSTRCKNKSEEVRLAKMLRETVYDSPEVIERLMTTYGLQPTQYKIESVGKVRFEEKFSFLNKYKSFHFELQQLNDTAETIKATIRKNGLSATSLDEIGKENEKINFDRVKHFFNDITNRLHIEYSKCDSEDQTILCCSEIIESIFGKFKMKTKQTIGGIYETVLSIVLFCNDITEQLVDEILTSTKMTDVENWFREMAGMSNLAKRRIAFG